MDLVYGLSCVQVPPLLDYQPMEILFILLCPPTLRDAADRATLSYFYNPAGETVAIFSVIWKDGL